MANDPATRAATISQFAVSEGDTGSPQVQIALLTNRIREVSDHLRTHRKDFHSRRGLIMMVGRRNRLLKYLAKTDRQAYLDTIGKLGLRK